MKIIGLIGGMCWENTSVKLFDTTKIHALAAVDWALS